MTEYRALSDVEQALTWALDALPEVGHLGAAAHPTGYQFEYVPAICPGCAYSVLKNERDRLRRRLRPRLYLVNVQYAVTERSVIEADTPHDAEAQVRQRLLIMDGEPRLLDVTVVEVAALSYPDS